MRSLGELFVIGFSGNLGARKFTQHAHFYLLPELPFSVLRYLEIFFAGQILASWLIFRHGVRVLITQSPYEGVAAVFAKKIAAWFRREVMLVVESHGDFEESLFMQRQVFMPRLYRLVMRRVAGFTLRHADSLRAVSNSTREQLKRWAPGKPTFQFVAWTDIETFLQAGPKRDAQFSQVILYAGVLIPRKGVHHLISAFIRIAQDFPQSRLVIAGSDDSRTYAAGLRAQVEQAGLAGRIEFLDKMPQARLASRMREACLLVLPSYSEGLPRVIYEAMAAGLPVVASSVSGIPEIVQESVTGFLVQPGDENALAERMQWVLRHPIDAREMGRRAHDCADRAFSTEAYVGAYHRMLGAFGSV
jgi:glycosyltransferase involved in cell wall biosynthesis